MSRESCRVGATKQPSLEDGAPVQPDLPEAAAPCDFGAFLAQRLGIESEAAALHVLGVMLREYVPLERRPIDVLEHRRGKTKSNPNHSLATDSD